MVRTGGITFKRVGRVGDSPIIGSGCLADNQAGAVSSTGHGESLMRYTLASRVLQSLEHNPAGLAPDAACASALDAMFKRLGGCGGAICVDGAGRAGVAFSTRRMAWAMRSAASGGVRCGIDRRPEGTGSAEGTVEVVDALSAELWTAAPLD